MPPIEAATFLAIGDRILHFIGLVREGKIRKNKAFDAALTQLYTAACETLHYARLLNEGEPENRDTERTLTKLWHDTAIAFRTINSDLADTCLLKGQYWLDPTKWTPEDVKNREIGIERVYSYARQLLHTKI
jgi:hypothetical protein